VKRKEKAPNTNMKTAAFYGRIDNIEDAGYNQSTVRMNTQRVVCQSVDYHDILFYRQAKLLKASYFPRLL